MSRNYDLMSGEAGTIAAPDFPYQPPTPAGPAPQIGLIGCGGITEQHLKAYRAAGWVVGAIYNRSPEAAERRRAEFYPAARVCATVDELLGMDEIKVVDIAIHPEPRVELIERAIRAGKHILSQKPFVVDLATGVRLAGLAGLAGLKLAVNQNGRWAPCFSYMRHAVRSGLIGEVGSVQISLNWDHTWTAGTAFEEIRHLLLFDFGIHWLDAARLFFGGRDATSVFAGLGRFPGQAVKPALVGSVVIEFPEGLATISFNGCGRHGARESCTIVGTQGTLHGTGEVCGISAVEIVTEGGAARAQLEGSWFPDGFRGTMGELLCAIEEDREPENSAADNLKSLALVLAAMDSADRGAPVLLDQC
jgi:predicted dehydrogenase